jgi:hypothetical protein
MSKRLLIIFLVINVYFYITSLELQKQYEVNIFKNDIINKIYILKDKNFVLDCFEYDYINNNYKLKSNLEKYQINKLNIIFNNIEDYKIDWISGRIYSSAFVNYRNDNNFAENSIEGINEAHEKAKANFYRALKWINIYESVSVLSYFEERPEKNRELYNLIDNSILYKMEYPDLNTIRVTYYIDIYGEKSLMNIMMSERNLYTEYLHGYMGFNYKTNYSGIIIDARGILTSFDGYEVKVKPALYITVKDSDGMIVFDKNHVYPDTIRLKGMVKYSYNINDIDENRVGNNPLKLVAIGTGDKSGSCLVVTVIDAKRMLSSSVTRDAIQNGKIIIVIDK